MFCVLAKARQRATFFFLISLLLLSTGIALSAPISADNASDYEESLLWEGKWLKLYPMNMTLSKDGKEIFYDENDSKILKNGLEWTYKNKKSEIRRDGEKIWDIDHSALPYQIDSLINTAEYAYLEEGWHNDLITGKDNIILRGGNRLCQEGNFLIKNPGTLAEEKVWIDCIHLPPSPYNYTNETSCKTWNYENFTCEEWHPWNLRDSVQISIDKKEALINYHSPWDPLIGNFSEGLTSCYPFTYDVVTDATGNHNGTNTGAWHNGTNVKVGNGSAYFQGDGDRVAYLHGITALPITVNAWIDTDSVSGNNYAVGIDKGALWPYNIFGYGNQAGLRVQDGEPKGGANSWATGWTMFTMIIVNNSLSELWRNGNNIINYTTAKTWTSAWDTLLLGTLSEGLVTDHFEGHLDEIGVWNRRLNITEIQELYNSSNAASCSEIIASGGGGACTPSWTNTSWLSVSNSSCLVNDTIEMNWTRTEYDLNECNGSTNTTYNKTNSTACDYNKLGEAFCNWPENSGTYNQTWMNFSGYGDDPDNATFLLNRYINGSLNSTNSTAANDTLWIENISLAYDTYTFIYEYYDGENWDNCSQITFTLSNGSCVPSWVNTSWSSWQDMEACGINDSLTQNRSLTEYDANSCPGSSNTTYWDFQEASCNYCSYSLFYEGWGNWSNVSQSCGSRNRSYWDENYSTCCQVTNISADCFSLDNFTIQVNYTQTDTEACPGSSLFSAAQLRLPIFLVLLFIALVLIVAGFATGEFFLATIGLAIIFVLGLVLEVGGLYYRTGSTELVNGSTTTISYVYSAFDNSVSHLVGWAVMVVSAVLFAISLMAGGGDVADD